MRTTTILLLAVVFATPFACQAVDESRENLELTVEYTGSAMALSKESFHEWLPEKMRTLGAGAYRATRTKFRLLVVPLNDSSGISVDTVTAHPNVLLCAYDDHSRTSIVVLKRNAGGYTRVWSSQILQGVGAVEIRDLNLDGQPEVITNFISSPSGYESVFFWIWTGDSLSSMSPSGRAESISELCGDVNYRVNDSGTVITSRPDPKFRPEVLDRYILPKGGKRIQVVKLHQTEPLK